MIWTADACLQRHVLDRDAEIIFVHVSKQVDFQTTFEVYYQLRIQFVQVCLLCRVRRATQERDVFDKSPNSMSFFVSLKSGRKWPKAIEGVCPRCSISSLFFFFFFYQNHVSWVQPLIYDCLMNICHCFH